jgi:hypothetical protein
MFFCYTIKNLNTRGYNELSNSQKKYFISLVILGMLVISICLVSYGEHVYSKQVLADRTESQQLGTFLKHKMDTSSAQAKSSNTLVNTASLKTGCSYTEKDIVQASKELKQDLKIVLSQRKENSQTSNYSGNVNAQASVGFYASK